MGFRANDGFNLALAQEWLSDRQFRIRNSDMICKVQSHPLFSFHTHADEPISKSLSDKLLCGYPPVHLAHALHIVAKP
jgi:hypothetical protein